MSDQRVYNFSAGPSMLPLSALERAGSEITNYRGSGMSVMEMSHRSKVFIQIFEETQEKLRRIMNVPQGYKIPIFLFGSGPLDMDIQSRQGAVTGLAFSMENREQGGVRSLSTTQVWHTVNALLGHGELLAHPSLKPVLSALKEPRPGTQSWTVDGWQLTLELELKGYDSHKGQLVSLPDQEQYVRYDFSIRQI